MGDFLIQFDTLLSKKGFTEDMLVQYNQSASAQFDNLGSNITTSLSQAGNNALEALNPLITKINQAFGNGSFDSFFNALSNGLTGICICNNTSRKWNNLVKSIFRCFWTYYFRCSICFWNL